MSLRSQLIDLDDSFNRLTRGVNAVGAMARAADSEGDTFADGLHAVWEYLSDAQDEARYKLDQCLLEDSCSK